MSKTFKKIICLVLAISVSMSFLLVGMTVYGEDLIPINSQNFTDATFMSLIRERYDTNGDGYLSASERSCTEMQLSGLVDVDEGEAIKTLKGIEHFTNLTKLRCGGIGLEALDPSGLRNLVELTCQGNKLTSLDISSNSRLQILNCSDNNLTELNVPFSTIMTELKCSMNYLTDVEFSSLPNLRVLKCDQNEFSSIDLTYNTSLTDFNCSFNHLTSIDLSRTALARVSNYMIGGQEITLNATLSNNRIIVPFTNHGLNELNYMGCSLDEYDENERFNYEQFVVYDVSEISDGIYYECSTKHSNSANMDVHINVVRDFYQVNFFTNDTMSTRISKSFVREGGSAVAPVVTDTPQCKAFDRWSGSYENVVTDKNVYVIWKDQHNYAVSALANDKDTVTLKCRDCDASYDVSFISIVNTTTTDNNFDMYVDVNHDNYINAKDYSIIYKQFGR